MVDPGTSLASIRIQEPALASITSKKNSKNRGEAAEKAVRWLNLRAVRIASVAFLAGTLILVALWYVNGYQAKATAMKTIKAAREAGKIDLALRNLQAYTATWPKDVEALRMLAEILADSANGIDGLINAAQANDQLRRLEPPGPDQRATRRRLVGLYIRHGNALQRYAEQKQTSGDETRELRYKTAATLAEELIKEDPKDADAHRLLAQAYDGLLSTGSNDKLGDAIIEFTEALRLDPGDVASAERLAMLNLQRRNDRAAGVKILDDLLKARPRDPETRMARFRFYTAAKDQERARAEIAEAVAMLPENPTVRIVAATDALRRGELAEARAQLDAVPAASQNEPGIRLIRGEIDLFERHPDDAIRRYRQGLLLTAGSDQDLTWRLARTLILLGRTAEARPVVDRFEQLEGEDRRSLVRYLRGLMDAYSNRPVTAIETLERALDRVPQEPLLIYDMQFALGRCQEQMGEVERAVAAYRRASAAIPRSTDPLKAIARLRGARDVKAGLDELEQALAKAPNDPALLVEVGRGRLAVELAKAPGSRDWAPFERFLDEADRLAPGRPEIRSLRVEFLALSDQLGRALTLAEEATRGPERKQPDSWNHLVAVLTRMGRTEAAIKALEEAGSADAAGDLPNFRILKAQLLANTGRGKEARETLTRGTEGLTKAARGDLARALGLLLRGLGDRAGARAALEDWCRLAPDSPQPGLMLMEIGLVDDDDESAQLGLKLLRSVGGEQTPYSLAARALELIRPRAAGKPDADAARRLKEADELSAKLADLAPQMPLVPLLRGMVLEREGNADAAIIEYRKALKEPTLGSALTNLLGLLTDRKMYDQIEGLKRQFQDKSDASRAVNFDRIYAGVSLKRGDKARAEEAVAKIVELRPDDFEARNEQVSLLDGMGKPQEAEATLRALVERRPESPEAWTALVIYQIFRGNSAEALKTIDRFRSGGFRGDSAELPLLEARCRWVVGDVDRAAKLYAAAQAARPDDPAVNRAAIAFYGATGRFAEAEPALRRVLKADPAAAWATQTLARCLASRGDLAGWTEAMTLIGPGRPSDSPEDRMTRAVVLASSPEAAKRVQAEAVMASLADDLPSSHPIAVEARCRLGRVMLEMNRPEAAEKYLAPAADDANPNIAALAFSAEALARAGRPQAAEKRIERMVAIEPRSPRIVTARAWTLHASGKPAEAAKVVEDLIASSEGTPTAESTAVSGHGLLSRMGQAEDAYRVAGRLAARLPRYSYLLARTQIARDDFDGALASCRASLAAGAPVEAAREAASLALARRESPDLLKEVDALVAEAVAKAPGSFEVPLHLATIRHLQGRYRDEIELYRGVLAVNPTSLQFLNNMAWSLSEGLHEYKEALERIDQLIARDGPAAAFLDTRGVILSRLDRLEPAIADLEESCRRAPDAATYFHLARAYLKAGKASDHARCRDLARKAKLDPATLDPTDRADFDEVMGPT